MLAKLRTLLPYDRRQSVYGYTAAVVILLSGFGLLGEEVAAL